MFSILTHGLIVKKKDVSFYKMLHLHCADYHSHIFKWLESPYLPAQYHRVLWLSREDLETTPLHETTN